MLGFGSLFGVLPTWRENTAWRLSERLLGHALGGSRVSGGGLFEQIASGGEVRGHRNDEVQRLKRAVERNNS